MKQAIFQVDAFTNIPFRGNPAAVCVLETAKTQQWMQMIAREMNLSETAFIVQEKNNFNLRWFTPTTEVPLCGHATLASAHILWTEGYLGLEETIHFQTKSGWLTASFEKDWIKLDFPVSLSDLANPPLELQEFFATNIKNTVKNSLGYLIEVETAAIVRDLQPNFSLLKTLSVPGVIVTSQGEINSEYDFVSRFFAPNLGIDEDPVTGAAHCCLAPFWRNRLNKDEFVAYQASPRGGVVKVQYNGGERVLLQGQAVTIMKGEIIIHN